MAATDAQVNQLRRMIGDTATDVTLYDDIELATYIENYPLLDETGEAPYTWDTSTSPPTQDANDSWVPTYDLHAAAADLWEERAALEVVSFDFTADGATYNRSQRYEQMMKQARYHRSRRSPTTGTLVQWPEESASTQAWIGNLPEPRT